MKASGPSFMGKAALAAGLSVMLALLAYGLNGAGAAGPIPKGMVMVGTGGGLYSEYTQTGTLITQLNTTSGSANETGCAFDPLTGDFYTTNFQASSVSKFDPTGAFITLFGSGYNAHPESIAFDGASPESVYVGQADGTHEILKFDTTGKPTGTFKPTTDRRGTDWIDLASDRCTMFYCSEGLDVERFNVCTNTQLTNFNTAPLPGSNAFAHRVLLPGQFGAGGVLVADSQFIVRLDSTGALVQHYTVPDTGALFALNLDPDGTSFWTGDALSGFVSKIDIKSGAILQHWSASGAPGFVGVGGVCIKGELISVPTPTPPIKTTTPTPSAAATPSPTATPVKSSAVITAPPLISVSGAPGQTVAAGTFTLTNTSSLTETFTTITLGLGRSSIIFLTEVGREFRRIKFDRDLIIAANLHRHHDESADRADGRCKGEFYPQCDALFRQASSGRIERNRTCGRGLGPAWRHWRQR